ncbi:MAG: glycosyltransferase [Nanoarchaeota archaeon]|nr:glycosyltransferase [Nanoarchaeota archaeon]
MISAIITAFKEEKTIGPAISALAEDLGKKDELIIIAPDEDTLNAAMKMKSKFPQVKILKDKGLGKSEALNLAVSRAKGNILVFTDGDVSVGKCSIRYLIAKFKDKNVGAVTGRPISINSKKTKYGFWAYVLTNIADLRRRKAEKIKRRFFCSGYLFAIKKELFPKLPGFLLSEDGFISHKVYEKGYKISYEPRAEVYVKYPENHSDWIIQKKRSAGGYNQIKKIINVKIRSFKSESLGFLDFFRYISSIKEFFLIINLFIIRLYLWMVIYRDVNIRKKSREELWKRVESTK